MKGVTFFLCALLFPFCFQLMAQTPSWDWARNCGGDYYTQAYYPHVTCDAQGNAYVLGMFSGHTITFGGSTLINSNPDTTFTYTPLFFVKYDSSGNVQWAKTSTGGNPNASAITTDVNGDIIIAGDFIDTMTLDGTTLISHNSTSTENYNFFIAKYTPAGSLVWAKSGGGKGMETSTLIRTDATGNVYATVATYLSDSVFIDNTILTFADTSLGKAFLVKYDGSGNLQWASGLAQNFTASYSISGISSDGIGNVYLSGGYTSDALTFGSITLTNNLGPFDYAYFLMKCTPAGSYDWAETIAGGTTTSNIVTDISTDAYQNLYMLGIIPFGGFGLNDSFLNSAGGDDIFLAKYDSGGNLMHVKTIRGTGTDHGYALNTDVYGNAYITGHFNSEKLALGNDTLTNDSGLHYYVAFIAEYDSSVNLRWAVASSAGGGSLYPEGITTDANGDIYTTGVSAGLTAVFGPDSLINPFGAGTDNYYLVKLHQDVNTGIISLNKDMNQIAVFPNPSNGLIYFRGVTAGSFLQVYNLLGESVYAGDVDQQNLSINLASKAKGVYVYRVTDNTGLVQQGKLIVE